MSPNEDSLVPTPDFYHYVWTPLTTAALDGRFVELGWADGTDLRVFDYWLRENAIGIGTDPATREGLLDPALLSESVRVAAASVGPDGSLVVEWSDSAEASPFHPGWLRHIAERKHTPASWIPEPRAWTTDTMVEPPTHDGRAVLDDENVLAAFLGDLLTFGLARLRGLPTDPEFGRALAAKIGGIRTTNFGDVWDVRAVVDHAGASNTNSTANTNLRLGPHTDLPTREIPPGFQFLHCIANQTTGGKSTMADGAAVADHLAAHHPDHYEALTTLHWIFFNRGKGIDHRWSGPMIDLGVAGSPLTLRAFYPVRAFPDMADADLPRAYEAMRCFSVLADSPAFKLQYPFEAGDLVGFDNRRILHGREAFSSGGARHLRGFYIDQDDVRSTARVTNRRLHADTREKVNRA